MIGKTIHHTFIPHPENDGHPHIMHHGVLVIMAILTLSMTFGLSNITDTNNRTHLGATVYSSLLIDFTNRDRADENLPILTKNTKLETAAILKANDMAEKSYFSHTSPEGYNSWHWFREAGYVFVYAGENLAVDFNESEDVADAWMNSPTHKANILNGRFTEIGIATANGTYQGHNTTFVAQMFGTPVPTIPLGASIIAAPIPGPQPEVLGEIKTISESSDETSSLVVGHNEAVPEIVIPVVSEINPAVEIVPQEIPTYTPWYQKLLVQASQPVGIIFIIIGSLLTISFVLSLFYHRKITPRIVFATVVAFSILTAGSLYVIIAHQASPLLAML